MRIAVVGSGIGGVASAYFAKKRGHLVTLYEANSHFGGHTHTHQVSLGGMTFPVDTGFLVHNDRTYPNLVQFFEELGIETSPSDMSFSVSHEKDQMEWAAGTSLLPLFSQPRNIWNPKFHKLIYQILKFNRHATSYLEESDRHQYTLGELLETKGYSREFADWFLLPMGGCIWSTPVNDMLEFPAETFIRFCINHGLLQMRDRPQWKTIVGGCNQYTKKVVELLDEARLSEPVQTIKRIRDMVEVKSASGSELFDAVVLAAHPPEIRKMLRTGDSKVESLLECFRYQPNTAVLHTDQKLLPKTKMAWSAWNYFSGEKEDGEQQVSCSYLINQLQPLPVKEPVIVTLNPVRKIDPKKTIKSVQYAHPLFDRAAIEAQKMMPSIQGRDGIFFAGAWMRYGFHEDGIWAAKGAMKAMDDFFVQRGQKEISLSSRMTELA